MRETMTKIDLNTANFSYSEFFAISFEICGHFVFGFFFGFLFLVLRCSSFLDCASPE